MTDDEKLLKRVADLLLKAKWNGNPDLGDGKVYVTFLIRNYADVIIDLSRRVGEIKAANVLAKEDE